MTPRHASAARDVLAATPEQFIATRAAAVARARAEDDPHLAEALAALPKPTRAAWILNLVAQHLRSELAALAELGDQLSHAQASLDATALRDLSARRRSLTTALTDQAVALATSLDRTPSAGVIVSVHETLQQVVRDASTAAAVRSGLLVRVPDSDPAHALAPGFAAEPSSEQSGGQDESGGAQEAGGVVVQLAPKRAAAQARRAREVSAAHQMVTDALAQVVESFSALTDQERQVLEHAAALVEAERDVERAREALREAERTLKRRSDAVARAKQDLARLQEANRQHRREVEAAQDALTTLRDPRS